MIERALIVRQPYADMILNGEKPWEMRGRPTNLRGRIGIIAAGTGLILGEVDLTDSLPAIDRQKAIDSIEKHRVTDLTLTDKWPYPWVCNNPQRYETPVKYNHPRGAVTWVKLDAMP